MDTPQRHDLTQPLAEIEISSALNGIAVQMASLRQIGCSAEQCREIYSRLLVEMSNAAEINMYGKTFVNPTTAAPEEVKVISGLLETTPTTYRNKLFLSPYERMSAGSGATIVQHHDGQDYILLIRTGKNPGEWNVPAGYMDPVPSSDVTMPDRLNPEERSIQEEALVKHKKVDMPAMPAAGAMPVQALPDSDATRKAIHDEYKRLLKEEGWQVAYDRMNDGDYLRATLQRAGLPLPNQPAGGHAFDATKEDNIRREAQEETGLDITRLEHEGKARITTVSIEMGMGLGSGGRRPNAVTPEFLIELQGDQLPALKPEDREIIEAKWVPVSAISRDEATGDYVMPSPGGTQHINAFAVPNIEMALHTLLNQRIKAASGGRVEMLSNLRAQSQSMNGSMALEANIPAATAVQAVNTLPGDALPSLANQHGQQLMSGLIQAAAVIGQAQDVAMVVAPARPAPVPTPWVDKITQVIIDAAASRPRIQ